LYVCTLGFQLDSIILLHKSKASLAFFKSQSTLTTIVGEYIS
jgi:hypothetical protein